MAGKKYKLILYIAKTSLTKSKLSSEVKKVIGKHREKINFSINESNNDYYSITIEGPIGVIDSCHQLITKKILSKFSYILVSDEAGDEIRKEAFIVLSMIEQRLRTFINQAMVEVVGWNWWEKWIPEEIKEKADKRKRRSYLKKDSLELFDFGDLISIMTANVRDWKGNKSITVNDLKDLLDENNTIEELKATLQSRTQKRSTWDKVFSIYFDDVQKWDELKEELEKEVLVIRHKVMHHRPVYLDNLIPLRSAEKKVRKILDTAKEKLSQTEKEEAQSRLEEITSSMQEYMKELHYIRGILQKNTMKELAEQWGLPSFSMSDIISAYRQESPIVDSAFKIKELIESQTTPFFQC